MHGVTVFADMVQSTIYIFLPLCFDNVEPLNEGAKSSGVSIFGLQSNPPLPFPESVGPKCQWLSPRVVRVPVISNFGQKGQPNFTLLPLNLKVLARRATGSVPKG